ncbi:MAG: hypothetical protein U0271_18450 [Polyangiaceae bacterium]
MSSIKIYLALLGVGAALAMTGCPEEPPPEPVDEFPAPPSGQGFQFGTGEQPVGAGEEVQNCFFFKVADLLEQGGMDPTKPLNLHRVQLKQNEGSHHMNIFRVRTLTPEADGGMDPEKGPYKNVGGTGPCFKSSNWADWPLVANTQIDGQLDWTFPDGVANVIEPDEWIMVQSHFVNATTQETPDGSGKVEINFWHLPEDQKVYEMGTLFATKQSIRICQGLPDPEFSGGCQFNSAEPVTVVGANGHFHSRGKSFKMYTWDGIQTTTPPDTDKFYESDAWDEPEMAHGEDIADIPANGGVFYTCDYQWTPPPDSIGCQGLNDFDQTKYMTPDEQLDCCYTFGPQVDRNEHCNIFVYYYPKSDDINCF